MAAGGTLMENLEEVGGRSDVTVRAAAPSNECNPFINMLKIDLVADKIMQFVYLQDMKALNLVSTSVLQAVRKTKTFSQGVRFAVNTNSYEVLSNTTWCWEHVVIDEDGAFPTEAVNIITDKLTSLRSLVLFPVENVDLMKEVLTKNPELRELGVSLKSNIFKSNHFFSEDVKQALRKLEALTIDGNRSRLSEEEDGLFEENFMELSQIPFRLKKLIVLSRLPERQLNLIPRLIEASKGSLEELVLDPFLDIKEMESVRLTKLRRLVIGFDEAQHNFDVAIRFMRNQPPLEKLVISNPGGGTNPPDQLLRFPGLLANLRQLCLEHIEFDEPEGSNWKLLEPTPKNLEDFHISGFSSATGSGDQLLKKLPDSMRKIKINGFHYDFWPNRQPSNIGELLGRFNSLTELNLMGSFNAINDAGLQTLIRSCFNLMKLAFSNCETLTDFGISGVRNKKDQSKAGDAKEVTAAEEPDKDTDEEADEEPGVPLSNLRGLVIINIEGCPNITLSGVLNAIRFDHLRSICIWDFQKDIEEENSRPFLSQLLKQNPCLEEVSFRFANSPWLWDEVRTSYPRVQQLGASAALYDRSKYRHAIGEAFAYSAYEEVYYVKIQENDDEDADDNDEDADDNDEDGDADDNDDDDYADDDEDADDNEEDGDHEDD